MLTINTGKGIALVQIKPIKIGFPTPDTACWISVMISSDNMLDRAMFDWRLLNKDLVSLANGVVMCDGADYENWDNSNEQAFDYVIKNVPQVEIA